MESEAVSARLRRWLESDYDAVIFELETIPIGYALFRLTDPELKAPDGIYLRQFFISPEYRRRGAGTAAFQEFVAHAVRGRRLVLEVLESNVIGQNFWRSLDLIPYSSTLELSPATSA
jgi:ribosomal protein S18 acetylase RimI-like enzyme